MVAAYGENYDGGDGVYRYETNGQELTVFVEGGKVVEIQLYYLNAAS
jgi:hypothetical protein